TVILEPGMASPTAIAAAAGASTSAPPPQPPVQEPPPSQSGSSPVVPSTNEKPVQGQPNRPSSPAKGLSPFNVAIIVGVLVLAGAAIVFTYIRNRAKPQPIQTAAIAKISASIQTTP